jgi:hypothetical protein
VLVREGRAREQDERRHHATLKSPWLPGPAIK